MKHLRIWVNIKMLVSSLHVQQHSLQPSNSGFHSWLFRVRLDTCRNVEYKLLPWGSKKSWMGDANNWQLTVRFSWRTEFMLSSERLYFKNLGFFFSMEVGEKRWGAQRRKISVQYQKETSWRSKRGFSLNLFCITSSLILNMIFYQWKRIY